MSDTATPTPRAEAGGTAAAAAGSVDSTGSLRPVVAMIGGGLTPYRLHFHRRMVAEIPEIDLWAINTHHPSKEPWGALDSDRLQFIQMDTRARAGTRLMDIVHHWRVGGVTIRWLEKHNAAAVLIHGYHRPGHLRIIQWCHRNNVPCYMLADSNIHADTSTGWRRRVKRTVIPWALRRITGIMVCGRYGREYFVRYGGDPSQMLLVPYEPDYARIAATPMDQVRSLAARFNFHPERKRIVFCGRLLELKRPDLALDSFAAIAHLRPEWDLVFVGDGPFRDMLAMRVPSDLRHRVRFTGFITDTDILMALYRSCHVLVLPSSYEPWGVVVNEAVASGMAVVVSDVVGAGAELVRDNVNGRIFPAGNRNACIRALGDATDPVRLRELRAQAPAVLADWRHGADPVQGIRAALAASEIIPSQPPAGLQGG